VKVEGHSPLESWLRLTGESPHDYVERQTRELVKYRSEQREKMDISNRPVTSREYKLPLTMPGGFAIGSRSSRAS
jgi:hypothetical protein